MLKALPVTVFLFALCLAPTMLVAQQFFNGSFEQHNFQCGYNLPNLIFNQRVPHVTALGPKSEVDVIKDTCGYGPAFEGRYFVALYVGTLSDAIALELDAPMVPGREYRLQFVSKDGTSDRELTGKLRIGFSVEAGLGDLEFEAAPTGRAWTPQQLIFTADAPYRYVGIAPEGDGWVLLDDFHFSCPEMGLGNDTTLCEVAGTALSVNPVFESVWSTGETGPSIVVDRPGLYRVQGVYGNCNVEDSILLSELDYPCECNLYLPTAFSPNGDGINDVFVPSSPCPFIDFELSVFNRWGQLVFRSEDFAVGWDGRVRQQVATGGVYAYLLRYRFPGSDRLELGKGELLLIR